jgi:hypothetical protein
MGKGIEDRDGDTICVTDCFGVKFGSDGDIVKVQGREDDVVVTEGIP